MLDKQVRVAAAVILTAAAAMASNFRAADQVYVPAAGHTSSATATFISDVWISNMSPTDSVDVSVIYTPLGATTTPQFFDRIITLKPSERRQYTDFFPTVLGTGSNAAFGSLIFNACKTGADCVNTVDLNGNSPNFRPIAVFSRIYSVPIGQTATSNSGTNGQDMPGIPWYNYVSARNAAAGLGEVMIQGLQNTGAPGTANTYRGNIGLVNASQFSTTTLLLNLYSGASPPPAQPIATATVTLGPLGFVQESLGQLFPAFAPDPTATNAFVTISQSLNIPANGAPTSCLPDGCPGFFAYASVLDNVTNDPTTIEAVYEKPLSAITGALDAIFGSASGGKSNIRRAVAPR